MVAKEKLIVINEPTADDISSVVNKFGGLKKIEVVNCKNLGALNKLSEAPYRKFMTGDKKNITPKQFADWFKAKVTVVRGDRGQIDIDFCCPDSNKRFVDVFYKELEK